ncbi:hypothetical protein Poli38472_014607 [Pythium oligandrum]|uniref:Myb-like domain-containing protein n=1 Tax=Pythium oligandrum TaxID=41045 RepID=A0A8K1FL05_PYTOL|nr:hypothetical protein Poli38472_014607 [Pythium oligandrum]|eukprot:TMW66631.1 hypothetical protein Poli38472_014607 [Pythium oligandrum]
MAPRWEPEEIELLLRIAKTSTSYEELAAQMRGRTPASCRQKCLRMHLKLATRQLTTKVKTKTKTKIKMKPRLTPQSEPAHTPVPVPEAKSTLSLVAGYFYDMMW